MPKIRYLHKTREGISSIYPKKSGDILQNMNFSRYYRNRGKFVYGFDPNIMIQEYADKHHLILSGDLLEFLWIDIHQSANYGEHITELQIKAEASKNTERACSKL